MEVSPSVIDLKKSFLSTQIRALNAPFVSPSDERENTPVPEEGELKEKVVQEVLQKCMLPKLLIYPRVVYVADAHL